MKKGYYIYVENCGSSGVKKKIDMQIKTFAKEFDIKGIVAKTSDRTLMQRIMGLFFWGSIEREYETVLKEMEKPDFVYIRRTYVDRLYLDFIKKMKEKYPKCKVIVEIPVFPYKKEMLASWYTSLMYIKEILYRNKYKEYIDRFVTYSDDFEIYGVPTIRTMNGVDVQDISLIKEVKEYNPNEINLFTVALLARHHGYERVIEGLYEYYKNERKKKVYLHIVGDGAEKKKYENLVSKFKLEKYVKFYGTRYGKELDELYNIADCGLAAFGVYKDGFSKLSTIKAREYLAKGLPVILGADDNLFLEENGKYGLMFPNDATPVEIEKVVCYLDALYSNKGKKAVSGEIRDFAYRYADNKITLKPVIDYINDDRS